MIAAIAESPGGALASPLVALALIGAAGIGAQWLAALVRLPSILLLLVAGIVVGPVLGWLHPRDLFQDVLDPIVSLAVGIILYEGGLSLRVKELGAHGRPILRLLTLGVVVTWTLATFGGIWIVGLPVEIALVLGAILTVTGPTVIGPLLRQVRPRGPAEAIARWEGIVVDVVGATLAVLVLRWITEGVGPDDEMGQVASTAIDLGKTLLAGSIFGVVGTYALVVPIRRHLIPDELENAVSLALALAVYVASDVVAHESGLLAVTLMGFLLANRKDISVHHIIEFKENLRVLLISTLFVVLAATIDLDALIATGPKGLAFVAFLILVVRPASVLLSTVGTKLALPDRAFLAALAPRGIVAAAVSSLFGLRLEAAGVEGAELLAPLAFLVIVVTVAVYGLGAGPVARRLGLSDPDAQGTLIAGAGPFALALGRALEKLGIHVVHVDTNRDAVARARLDGLTAHYGSILSSKVVEGLPLGGTGRFVGLTPNDEVNALAAAHFAAVYGKAHVFQSASAEGDGESDDLRRDLRGRVLFGRKASVGSLDVRIQRGATVKATPLTEEFDYEAFRAKNPADVVLLGVIADGRLELYTVDSEPAPKPGTTLLSVVPPEVTAAKGPASAAAAERALDAPAAAPGDPHPEPNLP